MIFRSIQLVFFVSASCTIGLVLYSVYKEQKYLKDTNLHFLNLGVRHLIHSLIIFTSILAVLISITFAAPRKVLFYLLALEFFVLGGIQVLMFFYAANLIDKNTNDYNRKWGMKDYKEEIALVEQSIKCCGYKDIALAISAPCDFESPCKPIIEKESHKRKKHLIILITMSLIFQIGHGILIYLIRPSVMSPNEFDELLVTGQVEMNNM